MIIRLSGGMGNQMFQYAFGKVMSQKKGEKLYYDTTAFYRDKKRRYALDCFNISAERMSIIKILIYNIIFYANRKLNFIQVGKIRCGVYFESKEFIVESIPENTRYCVGCWQNEKYFDDYKEMIKSDFELTKPLINSKLAIYDKISNSNMVAVHVRHGDYTIQKNREIYEIPSVNYYKNAMDYIRRNSPNSVFVFFSDDITWCKEIFGNETDTIFFEELKNNEDWEDFKFMTACRHFIIANSSFSWWASWLGTKEGSIKIAPNKWYVDEEKNEVAKVALLDDFICMDN